MGKCEENKTGKVECKGGKYYFEIWKEAKRERVIETEVKRE